VRLEPLNEPAPWIEDRWPTDSARVRSIVLVLHGGQARSPATVRRRPQLSYLRMVSFARFLHRRDGGRGMSVRILRYRYRGWDEPERHPVQDARWALAQLRDQHPAAAIALLGHSMGGRAALRVADQAAVTAVCALAPWTMDDEPVWQLAGRSVLIAHGDREHMTDPRLSYRFAVRAKQITSRVCRFDVLGDGHAMLRRAHDWSELAARFVATELGLRTPDPVIEDAMHRPAPEGLRVPLPAMTQSRWW
jgi:dienelactone hydrolase